MERPNDGSFGTLVCWKGSGVKSVPLFNALREKGYGKTVAYLLAQTVMGALGWQRLAEGPKALYCALTMAQVYAIVRNQLERFILKTISSKNLREVGRDWPQQERSSNLMKIRRPTSVNTLIKPIRREL